MPDLVHECPNGHCDVCAYLHNPELHERRSCKCIPGNFYTTAKGEEKQILCGWCRVKSFRAMNAPEPGNWSSDLTSSTVRPVFEERL